MSGQSPAISHQYINSREAERSSVAIPKIAALNNANTIFKSPNKGLRLKYIVALNDPAFLTARTHRENRRRNRQLMNQGDATTLASGSNTLHMYQSAGQAQAGAFSHPAVIYKVNKHMYSVDDSSPEGVPDFSIQEAASGARIAALQKILGDDIGRHGQPMPSESPWLSRSVRLEGEQDAQAQKLIY